MTFDASERNAASPGYWTDARRPLASLAFTAPLLLVYEAGVLVCGDQAVRNGVDVWLRQLLGWMGFGHHLLLPVLVCGILLAWHHATGREWRVGNVAWGMAGESLALAAVLIALAQVHGALWSSEAPAASLTGSARMIGYLGAGVYEELLFRLMLLPVLAALVGWCGWRGAKAWAIAALASSLLFAAAHYEIAISIGERQWFVLHGYPLEWASFSFRLAAGLFFAAAFLYRGFGIAVGAHAFYDIMVEMM